jgi:hypothetical protein
MPALAPRPDRNDGMSDGLNRSSKWFLIAVAVVVGLSLLAGLFTLLSWSGVLDVSVDG